MAPKKGTTAKSDVIQDGWRWVPGLENPVTLDSILPNNIRQCYQVDARKCEKGCCRVNCKKNPSCHNCLGERFWNGEIKDSFWVDIEDPNKQRKEIGSHVGLKNLGATCYVNTFLQLWFHNPDFRSAIFKWIPSEGYQFPSQDDGATDRKTEERAEKNNFPVLKTLPAPTFGSSKADNICGNLQLLFALLKHSEKSFVDPTPFVYSLGLQTDEQQDAQEFSKLFMSLLEDTLANQQSNIRWLVQDQYGGKYAYETRCTHCGKVSKTESNFYELDLNIQGHSMLKECIKEFLKEERLDGDNMYYCTNCQVKREAERKIVLQELPPVLNLQLLRFIFDRNTGSKLKCNSSIKFPDQLDMNEFIKFPDESKGIYELTAVLLHCGLSASSGHYVAHILDKKDDAWYRFNDEVVQKMTGRKLQLGVEEDPEDNGKLSKKGKIPKGYHSSKNAYMLVYSRKGEETISSTEDQQLPIEIQQFVASNNNFFDAWIKEVEDMRDERVRSGRQQQADVLDIYNKMQPSSVETSEWVSTDWLRRWLNEKQPHSTPIDNMHLVCKHGGFDPCKVHLSKKISKYSADKLFEKYGGLHRLQSDAFCVKCVFNRAKRIQFEARIDRDSKIIGNAIKSTCSGVNSFWVGRSSLKQWKRLALETARFDDADDVSNVTEELFAKQNSKPEQDNLHNAKETPPTEENGLAKEITSEKTVTPLREQQLSLKRKPEEQLEDRGGKLAKLEYQFSDLNGLEDTSSGEVIDCGNNGSIQITEHSKESDFNSEIQCSEHGNLCIDENKRRLISAEAWSCLKFYFKDCTEFSVRADPCPLCQVCSVKKKERKEVARVLANEMKNALIDLYHDTSRPVLSTQISFEVFVVSRSTVDEWKHFIRFAKVPTYNQVENIDLFCEHQKLLYSAEDIMSQPSDEEYVLLSSDEWKILSTYSSYDFEIKLTHRVAEAGWILELSQECCVKCRSQRISEEQELNLQYFSAPIYVRKVFQLDQMQVVIDGENSPDLNEPLVNIEEDVPDKKTAKKFKKRPSEGTRKSSRYRLQRGEYMFKVDSSQTLKDVKVQLIPVFSVIPCDQHLSLLNGTHLDDDSKSLCDLGIRPGSVLLLRVDEPSQEVPVLEETSSHSQRKLEEGFKGTGLYGSFQQS